MEGKSFYENVFLLTQAVPPSKDFLRHFKEGMFDKPNTVGFLQVSHYLLTIYDSERFKKLLQWPVLCKKTEAKYRTDVKDLLIAVANENLDVEFPQILASHLLHAGGKKFTTIMWKLSTVTLRTFIKRETGEMLLVPKVGIAEDLSRMMLNNILSQNIKDIEEINELMLKSESEAREYAKEAADAIQKNQEDLFLTRQSLIDLSSVAPAHPEMKKRLADPNDLEVIQIWENTYEETLIYVKEKQKRLAEIAELTNEVTTMVCSIVSMDTNVLNGKTLPIIDTKQLSENDKLSPETYIKLYDIYENDTLVLENFLSLLNLVLTDLQRYYSKNGFIDLEGFDKQITGSCEDLKIISNLFRDLHERIVDLTNRVKTSSNRDERLSYENCHANVNTDLFDSVLLKSSPTMNINWNVESGRNDNSERLELTPVENVHRALFARHQRNLEVATQNTKLRPKILVSRINFDDSKISSTCEKSPINRSLTSRKFDHLNVSRRGQYSRLFSTYQNRTSRRLNMSVRSNPSLSRINSIADITTTSDVYNVSELRSRLTMKKTIGDNRASPKAFTPTKNNNGDRASSTLNEDEGKFTPSKLKIENDFKRAISPPVRKSPKARQTEKSQNKRLSISDLVDRYKKLCNKTIDIASEMNFSSESSDESGKC